jgi:hypothetical protein
VSERARRPGRRAGFFFFDDRLVATKACGHAGVAGLARNPGGVPNFYFGFDLNPPAIRNALFVAFVKAPGNGVAFTYGLNVGTLVFE